MQQRYGKKRNDEIFVIGNCPCRHRIIRVNSAGRKLRRVQATSKELVKPTWRLPEDEREEEPSARECGLPAQRFVMSSVPR